MKEWMFCNAFKNDSLRLYLFNAIYYKTEFGHNNIQYLKYLACCKDEDVEFMHKYMEKLIEIYMTENPIDLINSFNVIVARHARNAKTLDYILKNMYFIKPRYIYFSS